MSDHRTADRAVHLVALPLLGVLGAVSVVRDQAARLRLRDDDPSPWPALEWSRLSVGQRARFLRDDEHVAL